MSDQTRSEQVDAVRRKLLKSSMVAGGFLAAGHLPYSKPALKSFFGVRSAWAQPSSFMVQFTGDLPDLGGGFGTGQDAWQFDTTQPNTTLTINAIVTVGTANQEIGLFAPGIPVFGVNLLTGAPGGYTGPFPVAPIVVAAVGTYTLAIEDNLINALQVPFSYQLDVAADMPIVPGAQVINDGVETLKPGGSGG
ncbi:MAG: hypothetical protein GY769_23485 [bacterium]|nr:hypothetical protein [bacterium]